MLRSLALAFALLAAPLKAQDVAGEFDYYILALSWTPTYCTHQGDSFGAEQCEAGRGLGWTLHGLWPQYETGWPSFCSTTERPPRRADTADVLDIMGSIGLAFYQWDKHGRCSGLPARHYYRLAREAYDRITRPQAFRDLRYDIDLPAEVVQEAFLRVNPGLQSDMITITCQSGMIEEARICLTRALEFRRCGDDVIRDCRLEDALMQPIR